MRPCKVRLRQAEGHWVLTIDGEDRLLLDPPKGYDPLDEARRHLEHLLGDDPNL